MMVQKEIKRWWVLGALSFALFAVGLDMTVLNIALPTLAEALDATTSELQWFADSYNLVLAALLLPAGMLGDRYGRKKWLIMALVLFGAGSIGCGMADSPEMLITMRAILGLGAAFLMPLSLSILPVLFEDKERTKAMMVWATINMLGIPLGPIVGGWLLKNYEWGAVFWINIPFVIIGLIAITILMPESRSAVRSKVDYLGVLTSSFGLISITYAVIRAGEEGWRNYEVSLFFIIGILLIMCFIFWERHTKDPLIELKLFQSRSFTWGSILATVVSFALFGLLFTIPLYFQAIKGLDALQTGLRLLPLIGGLIIGAKSTASIVKKIGTKNNVALGFVILAAGLFIGAMTEISSAFGFAALWITITGIGLGLALPTSMDAALGELTAEKSGVGSALIMAMRQVGGTIGVAILGSILNHSYRENLDVSEVPAAVSDKAEQSVSAGAAIAAQLQSESFLTSVQHAFINGMGVMLTVCASIAIAGFLMTIIFLPRKQQEEKQKNMAL
jgi:EmrB/QacA subfamily drug resistance transporter